MNWQTAVRLQAVRSEIKPGRRGVISQELWRLRLWKEEDLFTWSRLCSTALSLLAVSAIVRVQAEAFFIGGEMVC